MATENVTITAVGTYDGHTTKKNRIMELKLKFSYDERISSAQMVMLVGQNIEVHAKPAGKKPLKLGSFNFNGMSIDRDGQTVLKLSSDIDYVEHENIVALISSVGDDNDLLKIKLAAEIEVEETEEDPEGDV